jgi:hypothetical protein
MVHGELKSFPHRVAGYSGDFNNFDNGAALPVTADLADSLLGFVANGGNLLCLNVSLGNLGGNFGLGERRRADFNLFTVNAEEWLKCYRLAGAFNQFHFKRFALLDEILLAAGLNNCLFHGFFQKIPTECTKNSRPCKALA